VWGLEARASGLCVLFAVNCSGRAPGAGLGQRAPEQSLRAGDAGGPRGRVCRPPGRRLAGAGGCDGGLSPEPPRGSSGAGRAQPRHGLLLSAGQITLVGFGFRVMAGEWILQLPLPSPSPAEAIRHRVAKGAGKVWKPSAWQKMGAERGNRAKPRVIPGREEQC